ncbi:MAG: histidine--tRNA ligase [Acidimicrobiales bacterium]|nr:histidine--tRNA ligase [Acidimicrobiales bacterium]
MSTDRPSARLPSGFADARAEDVLARQALVDTVVGVYRLHGFEALETPALEYLDALGKHLPDEDAPDEGVFALRDDDDQWIALRYDLTAPLARFVAQAGQHLVRPFRRYQVGPVWRREKPGPGRFRQFTQCDFDTVGSASVGVDAEVCAVLSAALEALGIGPGEYVVRVNDRRVLTGVLHRAGIADARAQLTVLRAVDKLDRLGPDAVAELLGEGRTDASGDRTPGAGLAPAQVDAVLGFVRSGGGSRADVIGRLDALVGDDDVGRSGVDELARMAELLDASGLGDDRVVFDPTVVRGLAYYTGPVFEAELTAEIRDEKGRVRAIGSVAGGGRYDDLVERFTGEKVPACGASIGVDRLLAAQRLLAGEAAVPRGPVVVTVMDRDRLGDYQAMVAELRAAGIAAELYPDERSFKAQMKYADRRRSPAAVIAGSQEFEAGEVQVKDLALGEELAKGIADRDEWRTGQPAQRSVPRSGLVEAVAAIVGRPAPGRGGG